MKKLFFVVLLCGLLMIASGTAAAEEEYWITIDPLPDQMLGTTYTISGETNLPVGSKLLFEHEWTDWKCHDTRVCTPPGDSGMTATVIQVEQSTKDTNIWRVVMNTSEFRYAREFLVRIYSLDTPAWYRTTYNLIESTPETPWIVIDPISDQHRGTPVTITGSVFRPQEGRLLITIQPVWFDHNIAPDTAESRTFVKQMQITVPEGTTESYHWNISLDTTDLEPDMYRVEASGIDYDLGTQNRTFLLFGTGEENNRVIEISPMKHAVTGELLTVQGFVTTKNAATLMYELVPNGIHSSRAEIRTGYIRTAPVQAYGTTFDTTFWETTIDTAGLKAGNYTLKISALDAPVTATEEIELLDKGTVPDATQTPGFGCGILAIAFGTAAVLGTLRRK
ncbi:MAG: hypothetical protein O0V67_03245 [Methanocorpusculum sp.]|nr:hypothetical protein [Methanocorpusculum sp.]